MNTKTCTKFRASTVSQDVDKRVYQGLEQDGTLNPDGICVNEVFGRLQRWCPNGNLPATCQEHNEDGNGIHTVGTRRTVDQSHRRCTPEKLSPLDDRSATHGNTDFTASFSENNLIAKPGNDSINITETSQWFQRQPRQR